MRGDCARALSALRSAFERGTPFVFWRSAFSRLPHHNGGRLTAGSITTTSLVDDVHVVVLALLLVLVAGRVRRLAAGLFGRLVLGDAERVGQRVSPEIAVAATVA